MARLPWSCEYSNSCKLCTTQVWSFPSCATCWCLPEDISNFGHVRSLRLGTWLLTSSCSASLEMPRDVATCWNSTYILLGYVVAHWAVVEKITNDKENGLWKCELEEEKWVLLSQLRNVLKVSALPRDFPNRLSSTLPLIALSFLFYPSTSTSAC